MFSCILVSIERCAVFTLALFYSHRDQSYFYKLAYFFARFSSAGQMKFISYKLLSNSSMRKKKPSKICLTPNMWLHCSVGTVGPNKEEQVQLLFLYYNC